MRIHRSARWLALAALVGSTPVFASQTISSAELEEQLVAGQSAVAARDYDQAFDHYSQAARWGDKGAQYVLGHLYLKGSGTDPDPVLGTAWLKTAAEAPVKEFRRDAKKAMKELSPAEADKAERAAEVLIGAFGMDAAGVSCKKQSRTGSNIRNVECMHDRRAGSGRIEVPDDPGPDLLAQLDS